MREIQDGRLEDGIALPLDSLRRYACGGDDLLERALLVDVPQDQTCLLLAGRETMERRSVVVLIASMIATMGWQTAKPEHLV
jgi:hypothetical protein